MGKVKTGLLVTGGEAPERKWFDYVKNGYELVVAADSGVQTAMKMGVEIDYIVGDMDSIEDKEILTNFRNEQILTYDEDKDFTDTELGLSVLEKNGCTRTCIVGGGGGRLDHLIGILSLFDRENGPDVWITESAVIMMIRDTLTLKGLRGSTVSFFPAGLRKSSMKSSGLKWPLDTLEWQKGDAGVSNMIISETAQVTMRTGRLILVGELETLRGLQA